MNDFAHVLLALVLSGIAALTFVGIMMVIGLAIAAGAA